MECKVLRFCIFLYCFVEVVSTCRQDSSYPNLCDYNGNEYNVSGFENLENICDCQTVVFCSVITFVRECNSTTVRLRINDTTLSTQLSCDISPVDSRAFVPTLEMTNSSGNELSVKFSAASLFGMYKVVCLAPELSQESDKTFSHEWEIVGVDPPEIFVDSEVRLQLTLNKADFEAVNSTLARCFVNTPDNDTEVLSVEDTGEDQVTCAAFSPAIPGVFRVSLSSGSSPYTLKKSFGVDVIGKRPLAKAAEYGSDYERLFISFDANIQLHSACGDAFPKIFLENFGAGFDCHTRGNVLEIKMGTRFKIINYVTIKSDSKICRERRRHSRVCLSALPANLTVSKPKISGPGSSFYTINVCADNKTEKYISVRGFDRPNLPPQSRTLRPDGKTHRKNLMIWRNLRKIQSKFSSRLVLRGNNTDLLPFYENLPAFHVDSVADEGSSDSGVSVSVHVQLSLTNSPLMAEAQVGFCDGHVKLFRYKWLVNGRDVSEEGRLLSLNDPPPGKYLIKCAVVAYDSTEILGQGWATAEVFESAKEVLIVPAEAVVGAGDEVSLRAVTQSGHSVSWSCRTAVGAPCLTNDRSLVSSVCDFTSPHIRLPGGSLAPEDYVWTVESSGKSNSAKVSVRPGEVTVSVEVPAVFVDPSSGVVLNGSVQGAKDTCYARWSSVRQKGFSYLDLDAIGVREVSVEGGLPNTPIPLAIPPSPSGLEPDSLYLFKFQVFCPRSGSLRYTKAPLRTTTPPPVFPVTVEPSAGKAMITDFKVSVPEAEASAEDYPLMFEWSYVDPCDEEVPLGLGLSARNFTTYLPPGDVRIMARVCKGRGVCSTSLSPPIEVIQAVEVVAENFEKALHRIRYLMSSGDSREALGLAATVLKSLALLAEFEIREKVFLVVEESIYLRIRHLSEKRRFHPQAAKQSLEFCEQTETVAKYFRKNSAILIRLEEFRNSFKNHSKPN